MFKNFTFTKRYVLALSLIALLAFLAFINLNRLINSQKDDGKWIYISDHQRLLTQQIALYAIYYQTKELEEKINELQKSHILLVANSRGNEKLLHVYFHKPYMLNEKVKNFLFHANRFYENKDGRSLNYILQNSKPLLNDLEKIVNIYLSQSNSNIQILRKFEFYIFILTLSALIFEALFIFVPANKSILKKTKELVAEKEYINAIIQSSTDAIISLDYDAKLRTFNKEAQNIFNTTFEQISKPNSLHVVLKSRYAHLKNKQILKYLLHLSKKYDFVKLTLTRKNGEKFLAKISFGKSNLHKDIAILLHVKDISKEKLQDDIVLNQAKFAALGEMIALIAHQWRQPLAQLNFNYMYLKNQIQDEKLKAEIVKNEDIVEFMSETISNFEQFYKKTKDSEFDPKISIYQALNILSHSLKSTNINLIENIQKTCKIYGNTNNLSQVVLCILQNAISLAKTNLTNNPKIIITLYQDEKHIILSIKDNLGGIKISPIEDIFKPFISKKQKPSTGMGLYMSKLIIEEKFNGNIQAINDEFGANFSIKLPILG